MTFPWALGNFTMSLVEAVRPVFVMRDEVNTFFTKFYATPIQIHGLSRMMLALF